MTAADRVPEAPRPGHAAPGRHSAYGAAPERRSAGRRPTAWVVAPSLCSAVLAAAAIVIVVNGAHSAGYRISGGSMAAVWVLGGLIAAVVVATVAFAGRPGRAADFTAYPEPERRPGPPAMPQQAPVRQAPVPAPGPQQAPPAPPMAPHVAVQASEAAATLAAATKAVSGTAGVSDEGVDLQVIFAQLVRRLLTLVLQQINRLDELENEVEDPKLLKSLFGIDHQATQVRRYGENIGVLVGALPQRQWTHPVPVTVAQRSAVSETPDYPRVQVIPRAPGRIHGHAVSDVIHILSELVENATNYSNPTTKVTVGAHRVSAGLAIEINDHGIGMEPDQFRRLNTLLRDPSGANVRDLLSQGRIGLSVVAKMAQRHGIAVELAPNVTGGTMALVVIPDALLAPEELPADKGRQSHRGADHSQLPARPALAPLPLPLPDTLPPAAAAPSSAASLSPVAASTPPPLSSPPTAHVPPLPTSPVAASQEDSRPAAPTPVRASVQASVQASVPPPLPTQPTSASPLPSRQAPPTSGPGSTASGAGSSSGTSSSGTSSSGFSSPEFSPSGYAQPGHARQVPSYQSAPAEPQWPSTTPPMTAGAGAPSAAAPLPRPTGSVAPPPHSADPYLGQDPGASVPPWSRPGEQASEAAPGRLPDGRPQLRRRTPQGHISARLIQAEEQESRHGAGALSPTMMSDFWQGLSSGTAPADPPAAGPDISQHDRTTANRQEWNQ